MISYVGGWYEEVLGKSNPNISMSSISCGYEMILCACTIPMFVLWTGNTKG